jgi:hypothetical protein
LNHSDPGNNKGRTTPTDTVSTPKPDSNYQRVSADVKPSLSDILSDELKSYKDTTKVDTVLFMNKYESMFVRLRHYCTFDYKIELPSRFIKMYGLSKFQTHNFISTLEIKINSKSIYNGIITKADFDTLLEDELKKYGVLLEPNVELNNNELEIDYSISIPLSDVGKGVSIVIDTLGGKHATLATN